MTSSVRLGELTDQEEADIRPAIQKLIAIVAPPRSGSTVVTAALSVHSDVFAIYEPWNGNKNRLNDDEKMPFDDFMDHFYKPASPKSALLVKETATYINYIYRIADLLDTAPDTVDSRLIVIVRNPFHVFLSEVQARREWWGVEDLTVDKATFSLWAGRMLESCRVIARIAARRDSLLLSYDAFCREAGAVERLTRMLGIRPDEKQASFEKHLDRSLVRGDMRVSQDPRPISPRSIDYRDQELANVMQLFSDAPQFAAINRLAETFAALPSLCRLRLRPDIVTALQNR